VRGDVEANDNVDNVDNVDNAPAETTASAEDEANKPVDNPFAALLKP
jgi:hypothetical protein